jgi:hypothetical protein
MDILPCLLFLIVGVSIGAACAWLVGRARAASAVDNSLAVYRMVFGQSRQEELTAYLLSNLPHDERLSLAGELRINLEPPRAGIHIPLTERH